MGCRNAPRLLPALVSTLPYEVQEKFVNSCMNTTEKEWKLPAASAVNQDHSDVSSTGCTGSRLGRTLALPRVTLGTPGPQGPASQKQTEAQPITVPFLGSIIL